jgi:hypothetical protein
MDALDVDLSLLLSVRGTKFTVIVARGAQIFLCASASRMRSLRNDKHGYLFVASQVAEQVECDLLFTICTQPRCDLGKQDPKLYRPQPTTTTLLPHNLADPGEASPAFLPRSNTDRKLSTCRCTRPLTCMMPSRPRNQSCRRVLPFHALRPCNMHVIQGQLSG